MGLIIKQSTSILSSTIRRYASEKRSSLKSIILANKLQRSVRNESYSVPAAQLLNLVRS
jgi:hypothetical protein